MNGDKPSVYVETTIVSYLAARPSRDALLGAHQAITHDWWALRANYALHSSQLVQNESDAGDAEQVAKRKDLIAACSFLEITEQDLATAQALLTAAALPHKARADAVHIAVAARHKMVYLLTWNCKHIAHSQPYDAAQNVRGARKTGAGATLFDHTRATFGDGKWRLKLPHPKLTKYLIAPRP
jgi:PIN domain